MIDILRAEWNTLVKPDSDNNIGAYTIPCVLYKRFVILDILIYVATLHVEIKGKAGDIEK